MHWVTKKVIRGIIILFIISVFVFILVSLIPGNSVEGNLSPTITQERILKQKEFLGLDKPIYLRYFAWLKNILSGNLGYSFNYKMPVVDVVKTHIYPSILVGVFALFIQLIIGFPLGILGACYKKWGKFVNGLSFFSLGVPMFVLGLILKYILGVKYMILPLGGISTPGLEPSFLDVLSHLILPSFVLAFSNLGMFLRYIKYFTNDVLNKDYITLAVVKGLPKSRIIFSHIIKNMAISFLTVVGMQIPILFAGGYIVEVLFSINGMGKLAIQSFFARDYALIMAYTMIISTLTVVLNIGVDILYKMVDRRVEL